MWNVVNNRMLMDDIERSFECLKKEMDLVYICFFNSWYHYLGFLSYLKENNVYAKKIVVLHGGFLQKKVRINICQLSMHASNIKELESLKDIRKFLEPWHEEYIMVSASEYPYQLKKVLRESGVEARLLVVEEGLGTYGSYISNLVSNYRIGRAEPGIQGWLKAARLIVKSELRRWYFKGDKPIYWLNFDRQVTRIEKKVVSGYVKALSEICAANDFECVGREKITLFISSPFCEMGMVGVEEYLRFLEEYFCGKGKLYIKPHPAEDVGKYAQLNAVILESSVPVEILGFHMSQDSEIYSFSSTSLYTLRLFFGLAVVRIGQMDFLYKGLSLNQRRIMDDKVFRR